MKRTELALSWDIAPACDLLWPGNELGWRQRTGLAPAGGHGQRDLSGICLPDLDLTTLAVGLTPRGQRVRRDWGDSAQVLFGPAR